MRLLFSIVLISIITACSAQEKPTSGIFEDVTKEKAIELMASNAELQVIDVRQNSEVERGMIEGARQMDISKPAFNEQIEKLDKNKPVLVYCASGHRSKSAQEIMQENGFQEVYNLLGGYEEWSE